MKLTKLGLAVIVVLLLAIAARFAGAMSPSHSTTTPKPAMTSPVLR